MLNYTTYQHTNSKVWVTFVHGAGGSSHIWHKQIREFKKHFNILLVDLPGHGGSEVDEAIHNEEYSFDKITDNVIEVVNYLKIKKSHFVGVSLGTIIIRNIAENYPKKVESLIMAGAVMRLNIRSRFLIIIGNVFKHLVPYMTLYKFLAYIILPYRNHRESRQLFIREAKKLGRKEFFKWSKLTKGVNTLLRTFRSVESQVPMLYVMGGEDYLFVSSIEKLTQNQENSSLLLIEHCGHLVNLEQPLIFNRLAINYVSDISWESILVQEAPQQETKPKLKVIQE